MPRRQFEVASLRFWIALVCIVLGLVLTGVETVHSHSVAGASNQCAICISVHPNAPATIFQPLPVLHALDTVPVTCRTKGKVKGVELDLFTRPPPALS